jgi:endonuclease/exonuclease/phosphatase (EEP) superfamily protein YafD
VAASSVSGGEYPALFNSDHLGPLDARITTADACAAALTHDRGRQTTGLMRDSIHLLNWNIHKNHGPRMQSDLARLAEGADLVLLQEAAWSRSGSGPISEDFYRAFAPGYRSWRTISGVMTASKAPPLTQCSFKDAEPWLRAPKATNVTQYSLADREDTLVVINLHLINFTLGVSDMKRQLEEALLVIEGHRGPVIVSGDFNTWSRSRVASVATLLQQVGLDPVAYESDLRKRVFGHALDHVFVRGMEVVQSTSHATELSDHNPMSIVLKLLDPAAESFEEIEDDADAI